MRTADTQAAIDKWLESYWTIAQAAEHFGVTERTIYRWSNEMSGVVIVRIKVGKRMRQIRLIPKAGVEAPQEGGNGEQ